MLLGFSTAEARTLAIVATANTAITALTTTITTTAITTAPSSTYEPIKVLM